jgi:hypothetical protein
MRRALVLWMDPVITPGPIRPMLSEVAGGLAKTGMRPGGGKAVRSSDIALERDGSRPVGTLTEMPLLRL